MSTSEKRKPLITLRELCIFAMIGALMFVSKKLMELLPNIHLLAMITMVCTVVFRFRALIPIYIYVFLEGLFAGFSPWWYPYLYIWAIYWAITMLLPKRMSKKTASIVYPIVCAIFGLAFGSLYAPVQAILQGFNFQQTLIWIAQGLGFDVLHLIGNAAAGLLVYPLSEALKKALGSRRATQ